jgi:hypothetical protein
MTTPGALSFNCDMVMNIPFVADLTLICDNCQRLIDERVIYSNAHCHSYDYQPDAICECMHQAVGNSLHVLTQWTPPNHLDDTHLLVDTEPCTPHTPRFSVD